MLDALDVFIARYHNRPIDFDGNYGYQCMDLYRQYVQEALGFPQSPGVAGAADVYDHYLTDYFDRFENTPEALPQRGDIIIWRRVDDGLPDGHIAIFISGDLLTFTSFDQNSPHGSYCHYRDHQYTNVHGWLRPKQPPIVPSDDERLKWIAAVMADGSDAHSKLHKLRNIVS
jgi:CHAP domain